MSLRNVRPIMPRLSLRAVRYYGVLLYQELWSRVSTNLVFRIMLGVRSIAEKNRLGHRTKTMVCHVESHASKNELKNCIVEIIERDILCLTLTTI